MIVPENPRCKNEPKILAASGALPNPPPLNDRLHVQEGRAAIPASPAIICLALVVSVLAIFRYPQLLDWEKWRASVNPKTTSTSGAQEEGQSRAPSPNHKIAMSRHNAPIRAASAKSAETEASHLSANDLALGFEKARWGMSINDAKSLWPLVETTTPDVIDFNAPHVSPIHDEDMLSLERYAYAGCVFSVKFKFEDKKLFSVQMEADGSENFGACHAYVRAALTRQYSAGAGGANPLTPYLGYSLHGFWKGPYTTVTYNEISNAVMEIIFSARD